MTLGGTPLTISDVNINLSRSAAKATKSFDLDLRANFRSNPDPVSKRQTVSGHLEADLPIGAAMFVASFDFGPVKIVTGTWRSTDGETLGFAGIAKALGIDEPVDVPFGLDFSLKSASFSHEATNVFGDNWSSGRGD